MKTFGMNRKDVTAVVQRGDVTFAVYGMGKMGLPLAISYAEAGGKVIGVDIDAHVVETLNQGVNHIEGEPGLPELVPKHAKRGTLRATTDLVQAARDADVMVIIVPTLLQADNVPDLSIVESVCRCIGKGLKRGDLVIQESTLPPGSTEKVLRPALEQESGLRAGVDFGIAFCPERTLSGRALADIQGAYPKVVGGVDSQSTEAAAGIYEAVNQKGVITVSGATEAEAVKVFEGVYRDVNIALANELALACEEMGIDAREVFAVANTQPYSHIHEPGCGVGGHCIPVYPYFLIHGVSTPTPLLQAARRVNDAMPAHTVDLVAAELAARGGSLAKSSVLVVGITYRQGVRETRFSPAIDVINRLLAAGATVDIHDPLIRGWHGTTWVDETVLLAGLERWNAVIFCCEISIARALPWDRPAGAGSPIIVDGRRAVPIAVARSNGWSVRRIGAP